MEVPAPREQRDGGTEPRVNAQTLLSRLQADAADSLAELSVNSVLDTKLVELVPPAKLAADARKVLDAWLASETAVKELARGVEWVVNRLNADRRTVGEAVPREAKASLKEMLRRPFSPDRKLVLTVIDRDPTRELVRQLLLDAVLEFGRRASAPVAGMARGLGSLAKLAGETVKSRGGTLGSLVGAVGGEVERQLEKRAVEFVDSALAGVFGQIADAISDPRRAAEAAELRVAFMDGVLELTFPQLARELVNLNVDGGAEVLRSGLRRWLATPEANEQLEKFAALVLEREGQRTAREVLKGLGLEDTAKGIAKDVLAARIRAIAATPEFASWLQALIS
jgi:hypothetical protein